LSELPQITVPELLFNVLVSGLVCAATWHAVDIIAGVLKSIRAPRSDS
jgi:hypothetical protein